MKRAGKLCAMLCLLAVLSGCGCQKSGPLVTVVEKVEVVSNHGGEILNRTYTKSGKMTAVLNYVDFVKVQTACNAKSGWLGEQSTEVVDFLDYGLMLKRNE